MLKFPADDPCLDLTDLFVFASPKRPDKTVLILDVDPFMTGADFQPEAVYRINVDNDDDAQADVAISFVYSESNDGVQKATVYYATGIPARQPEPVGEVLIEDTPARCDAMATPVEPADVGYSAGSVATRSSPAARARSTTTNSPAATRSPARTS
jgi:hypothetical protein